MPLCNWLTKGTFEKWESFASFDGTASRVADVQEVIFLRDAKTTLVFHPRDQSANLRPPGVPPWTDIFTPLNMMIMAHDERLSPQGCIEKAIAGEFLFNEIAEKRVNNKTYYYLTVSESKEVNASMLPMVIDPSVGFLPVEYTVTNSKGDNAIECKVLETKQLKNGAWFPMSSRMLFHRKVGGQASKTPVYRIQVLEVDASTEPRGDEFSMDLPKGREVLNLSNGTGYFRVNEDRRVLAKDLNELVDYTEKIIKYRKLEAKAERASEADSETSADAQPIDFSYHAIMATSLIFVVIIGACLWFKLVYRNS